MGDWQPLIRALMYVVQFEPAPEKDIDRVMALVIDTATLGGSRSDYLDAVREALKSEEDLSSLIPQQHSDPVIRHYLRAIESRMGNPGECAERLLRFAAASRASDLHLAAGKRPMFRIDGELRSIRQYVSEPEFLPALESLMNEAQRAHWRATGSCVFMYSIAKLASYRIRLFTQHRGWGAAIRILPRDPPELGSLGLPAGFTASANRSGTLVLFTGPAGCGRTTSLTSMLLRIGTVGRYPMASIGRLIEFDLAKQLPELTQIDLTQTAGGYPAAIREAISSGALVIAVDDASDPATMIEALRAAQQGLTVLCGLGAANVRSAVDEIIRRCPEGEATGRRLVADTLRMALCQHWVRTVPKGRTLAFEVLIGTPSICSHIRQLGTQFAFYSAMQTGVHMGMQIMGQHIHRLFREGRISSAEARAHGVKSEADGWSSSDAGLEPPVNCGTTSTILQGLFVPEELADPEVFERVTRYRNGLVIVTGPPGSGVSATAAYLLSHILMNEGRHVVTLESQVEHAFEEGLQGHVTRHELQAGQGDLADAVGAALSEDPDVLFLGVEPDAATLTLLLDAAHSRVLVLIVLPARSVVDAAKYLVNRIPACEQPNAHYPCMVRAVVAQRLLPRVGGGRVAVYEILVGMPAARNLIELRRFDQLQQYLETGQMGMQTFDRHVSRLVEAGTVSAGSTRLDH